MTTPLEYIPAQLAVPFEINGMPAELPDFAARQDAAKQWLDLIDKYENREDIKEWMKVAQTAKKVYHNDHDNGDVIINLLHANTNIIRSSVYPNPAKPSIEPEITNDPDKDKVLKKLADTKKACLNKTIDNGRFDIAMKKAINEALICGRGFLRFYLYAGYNNMPDIHIESIAYDQLYISPCDTWKKCFYTIQKHVISPEELHLYMDDEMATMPYPRLENRRNQNHILEQEDYEQDSLVIWEIWTKYPEKRRLFIRDLDGIVLLDEPDPYQLPCFFPYSSPLIPVEDKCLVPTPPYKIYRTLHQQLNTSATKNMNTLKKTALKYLTGLNSPHAKDFVEAEVEGFYQDPVIFKDLMVAPNARSVGDLIFPYPVKDQMDFMNYLDQKEMILVQKIFEISGVSDIQRGISDPDDTATAQKIKQSESALRIKGFADNVKEVVRDSFQIMSDMIHRQFPAQYQLQLAGVMPNLNDPNDQTDRILIRALQTPDIGYHMIDVESESLKILDREEARKRVIESMNLFDKMFAIINARPQDDPVNTLSIIEFYEAVIDDLEPPRSVHRKLASAFRKLKQPIEWQIQQTEMQEKQIEQQTGQPGTGKAIVKQQKEQENMQKAIAMDPAHRKIMAEQQNKRIDAKLEMVKEDNKFKIASLNAQIALKQDQTNQRQIVLQDQFNRSQLRQQESEHRSDRLLRAADLALRKWAIRQETRLKEKSLNQKQLTGSTSYQDVEFDSEKGSLKGP